MQDTIQKYTNLCAIIGEKERIIRSIKRELESLYAQTDALQSEILKFKTEKAEEEKKDAGTN